MRKSPLTIELPSIEFGARPNELIPVGATEYETEEISRCWRNAAAASRSLALAASAIHGDIIDGATVPHQPGAGIAQPVADLTIAIAELRARRDGAIHRLAIKNREESQT